MEDDVQACEYLFRPAIPTDPGYIRFPDGWKKVPGSLNSLLWSLTEYRSEIKSQEALDNSHASGVRMYQVQVHLRVKRTITYDSGPQTRFVSLRKETPDTGWKIDGIGTGP